MQAITRSISDFLDTPYLLTNDQIEFYQKNQFIKLKEVLNTETIQFFNTIIYRTFVSINHFIK